MNGSAPVRVRILPYEIQEGQLPVCWQGTYNLLGGPVKVEVNSAGEISIPGCPDTIFGPAVIVIDQPGPPPPTPAEKDAVADFVRECRQAIEGALLEFMSRPPERNGLSPVSHLYPI